MASSDTSPAGQQPPDLDTGELLASDQRPTVLDSRAASRWRYGVL